MVDICENYKNVENVDNTEKLYNINIYDIFNTQLYESDNTDTSENSIDNNNNNNRPIMFSGPSAVGKDTMINKLEKKYPNVVKRLPSYTTRPKRPGEIDGVDYYFVTKEQFLKMKKEGLLFGIKEYNNNFYASNLQKLQEALADKSKITILNYNIETAIEVKDKYDFYFVGLFPPNEEVLRERMIKRNKNTKADEIEERMKSSVKEMQLMQEADFINLRIVNDDEERAFDELESQLKKIYPQLQ